MQIGVSITLAFSVYKLRLSDDVPVQSDIVPLINIYFILCMFFSLSAMLWFSVKNIMMDNKKCPAKLKFFVENILLHLMFLKNKYKYTEETRYFKNKTKKEKNFKNILKSSKSMPLKLNNSKLSFDERNEIDALYEDLSVYNQKPAATSIPLYEIDHHGRRSLISRDNSLDLETSYCKKNDLNNKHELLKKSLKNKIFEQNNDMKKHFEKIDKCKLYLDDFERIKIMNKFVFILYLIYFLLLNLLCLFILPVFFKKSLSIND
jgi:hypothetical protein